MCYAIPGKVTNIDKNIISVNYFGQRRKARNDFFELKKGDYVYAQGGFVVQKVSSRQAKEVLGAWKELFFKLEQRDLRLSSESGTKRQMANSLRQKHSGNSCCIHGIIEFSNHCADDCLYCGLRRSNSGLKRYRMSVDEVADAAHISVNKLKFKALVLQSGEDKYYDEEKLLRIVKKIRQRSPALLILSIGERSANIYKKLYQAGARGVLLRFETSNEKLYARMRPGHILKWRIDLIKKLRKMGYLVMTGFLIGLPGQSRKDLLNDIKLTASLGVDMFSFGPFIPHSKTPLADCPSPSLNRALDTIANVRVMNAGSKILVTTAFEALDRRNGLRLGLLSGGNSLMIDVTPRRYQRLYDIYPGRIGADSDTPKRIASVLRLLRSIGRAPVDLSV